MSSGTKMMIRGLIVCQNYSRHVRSIEKSFVFLGCSFFGRGGECFELSF